MRLHFPNLNRPKKSAKILARQLGISLSTAQRAVARISGYQDWHNFEKEHSKALPSRLDQELLPKEYIDRQASLSLALANELGIPDGDAQFALANARLSGDVPASMKLQIAIRLECWRHTVLPVAGKRQRGEVGRVKSRGRNGEIVILRSFGRPTTAISEQNVSTIADFEYVSPRIAPPIFLPKRLYLPYGYWTEHDGARVLYSRDYKPLWRLRDGCSPERLEPSSWIEWRDQTFLWDEVSVPWRSVVLERKLMELLAEHGIHALPVWADALPIIVHNDEVHAFSKALEPLNQQRNALRELGRIPFPRPTAEM